MKRTVTKILVITLLLIITIHVACYADVVTPLMDKTTSQKNEVVFEKPRIIESQSTEYKAPDIVTIYIAGFLVVVISITSVMVLLKSKKMKTNNDIKE